MNLLRAGLGTALVLSVGACGASAPAATGWTYGAEDAARDELTGLIEDVTAAQAYRYDPHDDRGNTLTGPKILQVADGSFVATYFSWFESGGRFQTHVGTSSDLINWTWRRTLGESASQPTIAEASDGGYVVGWEQEPHNHLLFAFYPTLDDLLAGNAQKTYEPPTQLSPDCAEGTPSFYSASSTFLDVGFHYYRDCQLDRQAHGTTDWTTWTSSPAPDLDAAIERLGVKGGIGDRDGPFEFRDYGFMVFEGMRELPLWETFRVFLYDRTTGSARQLDIHTHAGSRAFTNPTIGHVTLDGRATVVVSLFIPSEGSAQGEAGGVVYYRFID